MALLYDERQDLPAGVINERLGMTAVSPEGQETGVGASREGY
jgi:hypothetical protein